MKRLVVVALLIASAANAQQVVFFSTNGPDGRMGMASRPAGASGSEREAADDFLLTQATTITNATFAGLLPRGSTAVDISQVTVELYRVYPNDSHQPASGNVPTRLNGPSDNAHDSRTSGSDLTFTATNLGDFTVANSVIDGIHPSPNSQTGGNGFVSGTQFSFSVGFLTPFVLPADHYFFVPQVALSNGTFLWLSSPHPITTPGTPFVPDLQAWIRSSELAPDWLRVGTDIVGGGQAFNGTFSLSTTAVVTPEPSTLVLLGSGLLMISLGVRGRRPGR